MTARFGKAVIVAMAMAVAACREAPPIGRAAVPYDLEVAALDSDCPSTFFDGVGGSLMPGPGWSPEEGNGKVGDPASAYAWVESTEARLTFLYPRAPALDLDAYCAPFNAPGLPPQSVSVEIGSWRGDPVQLRPGWQEVRIPLPAHPELAGRLTTLRLHFARATSPASVGMGPDLRTLAATFDFAAIVPRDMAAPRDFLRSSELDAPDHSLTLPAGGSYTLPVPAGSRVTAHLGRIRSDCPGCRIGIEIADPGREARQRWLGTPKSAAGRSFALVNSLPRPSIFRIEVIAAGGARFDPGRRVHISLPRDFIQSEPLPGAARGERPDVFVYLIDTLRADDLSLYGYRRPTSPRIDAFARDAVTYRRADAASTWTLPSTASLLTGVFPFRHGLMTGERTHYAPGVPVLAGALDSGGYATLGVSHSLIVSPEFGLSAGFETFLWRNHVSGEHLASQEVRRSLVDWIESGTPGGRPLFAYLHTVDPHDPYSPRGAYRRFADESPGDLPAGEYRPEIFAAKGYGARPREVAHLRALYDGAVLHGDAEFGRFLDLLKFLGLYDDSAIVLTADHGEEFGEHGGFAHGRTMYQELLHVPLVVKFPGGKWKGASVPTPVSLVDVAPTILDLAGIDRSRLHFDGVPLAFPRVTGHAGDPRILFSEVTSRPGPGLKQVEYKAITISGLKCIFNARGIDQFGRSAPRWSVYDLATDPGEERPLAPGSERFVRAVGILDRWLALEAKFPFASWGPTRGNDASPELLNQLRSLGYLQ